MDLGREGLCPYLPYQNMVFHAEKLTIPGNGTRICTPKHILLIVECEVKQLTSFNEKCICIQNEGSIISFSASQEGRLIVLIGYYIKM